jgi:hypothetical protein
MEMGMAKAASFPLCIRMLLTISCIILHGYGYIVFAEFCGGATFVPKIGSIIVIGTRMWLLLYLLVGVLGCWTLYLLTVA